MKIYTYVKSGNIFHAFLHGTGKSDIMVSFLNNQINQKFLHFCFLHYPAGIYLLKVNNRNTEIRCEISSKLTIKTPERRQACNFIKKETLTKVFSCEFYEISKNTFSYWTPPVAASVVWEVDSGILHYFNGQNVKPATGGVL